MARTKNMHSSDIPDYLWEALDKVAAFHNIPTNRMLARWLWEHARRHAGFPGLPPDLARVLADLPNPYDHRDGTALWREYPRIVKGQESDG